MGRISLDATPLHATLRGVEKAAGSVGANLKKNLMGWMGPTAIIAGAGLAMRSVTAYADGISELSDRLRTNTNSSQEWNLAATLNGEQAEFVASSFQKMEKALISASEGSEKSAKSLRALGISATEFRSISVDEAMRRVIQPTATIGTESERAAASLDIFGKSASKVGVVLDDLGKASIFTKIGAFADEAAIRNVKLYADAWASVGTVLKAIGTETMSPGGIISQLIPAGPLANLFGLSKSINKGLAGNTVKAGDGSLREAKEWNSVMDKAAELREKTRVSQLSDEQRINELIAEREAIFKRITTNGGERAKKELALAENEAEISLLKRRESKATVSDRQTVRSGIMSDSLTAVGNFIGQSLNAPQLKQLSEQTKLLRDIKANTAHREGINFPL